jgi:predicted naringenin-chalcone synthase
MKTCITGFGTAVPDHLIEQSDAAEQAAQIGCQTLVQQRLVKTLYRRAGVRTRRSVVLDSGTNWHPAQQNFYTSVTPQGPTTAERMAAYERHAPRLAVTAAAEALANAGVQPHEITHLVTVSCSGFSAPGIDLALFENLGLSTDTTRTHVGFMGCHGALNGLRVAEAFAKNDDRACVLVCAVELCSLHHQYDWQPEQIVANALFGDGAASVVVRSAATPEPDWQIVELRSAVIPRTDNLMSWRIGDHGFQMTLSPRTPQVIDEHLKAWLTSWLATHQLGIDDIRGWAIHPGGPRILDACANALGLADDALDDSRSVLAEFGNMSSPTVLFILDRIRRRAAASPCVVLAFGPGLTIEGALLR